MSGSYIGKNPQYGFFEKQRITTANGVLTAFNLAFTTSGSAQLLVSVAGVIQEPGQSYTILSGSPQQISFTEAPANGVDIFIIWMGKELTGPRFGSDMITDQTALGTAPAATDQFIVYDVDASSLKKVAYSNVHSGVADMAANTVKVRDANSTGAPSDKTVADTQLLIGDGTGFTAAALSGDVTMSNAGLVSIGTGVVDSNEIATGAITNSELANDAVSNANVTAAAAIAISKLETGNRGDIQYWKAATTATRLAVGTADQVLTSDGTDVAWADSVGGAAWALKTASYTAVAADGVMVDTSSSAITITLPISSGPPSLGDFVRVLDATGDAATNNITVARNGNNIQGAAADLTIATNRAAIGLVYVNATEGWVLIEN